MADLSLDAYISKSRGTKFGRGLGNRLGNKRGGRGGNVGRGRGASTAANKSTSQNKNFDARQKLSQTKVTDARQKLKSKSNVTDARQKIQNKTNAGDARQKIQEIKSHDARSKIEAVKAKKVDARQKIQAKKETISPRKSSANGAKVATQVTVTNVGRVLGPKSTTGVVQAPGGHLIKTVQTGSLRAETIAGQVLRKLSQPIDEEDEDSPSPYPQQATTNWQITVKNPMAQVVSRPTPKPTFTQNIQRPGVFQVKNDRYIPQVRFDEEEEEEDDSYANNAPTSSQARTSSSYQEGPLRSSLLSSRREQAYESPRAPVRNTTTSISRREVPPPRRTQPAYLEPESSPLPVADVVSPSEGFRIMITNLHPVVTEEDIVELFGALGDLKRARLLTKGTAEVVYTRRPDALNAVKKYHMRELDGQPMQVVMSSLSPKPPAPKQTQNTEASSGPLRLAKEPTGGASCSEASPIDSMLIHRALFKSVSKEEPRGPVSFTVKI